MDLERLFDIVCHMKDPDTRGSEYRFDGKLVLNPKQQRDVVTKSIQAFVHGVAPEVSKEKRIQAFSGSSDLPVLTKDVFNVTHATPNYDLLWQNVFKGVKLLKGQLAWEIGGVSTSTIFKLIPEGGKIEFESMSGEKVIVDVQKYGAGLGVTWETTEGRKLYKFVDQMEDMRSKLYTLWANIHYGLLATAGLSNQIAYQGAATDSVLSRDIATLNKGADDLGVANKDKGYGDTANARFALYASTKLRTRINQALRVSTSDVVRGGGLFQQIVDASIDPYYTLNAQIPANKALLVLPGNKIQNAVYLRELGLSETEISSLNELRAYWTAFGASVADTDQVYELAFA